MSGLHFSTVERAHAYTNSKVPWQLEFDFADPKDPSKRAGGRLFRYLSGGGVGAFGRTIEQEERRWRRRRFLFLAAVFALVWTIGYFI